MGTGASSGLASTLSVVPENELGRLIGDLPAVEQHKLHAVVVDTRGQDLLKRRVLFTQKADEAVMIRKEMTDDNKRRDHMERFAKEVVDARNSFIKQLRTEVNRNLRKKALAMMTLLQEQVTTANMLKESYRSDEWEREYRFQEMGDGLQQAGEKQFTAACNGYEMKVGCHFPDRFMHATTPTTRKCREAFF